MINIMNPFARASIKALWDAPAPAPSPASDISVATKSSKLSPVAQVFAPTRWRSLSPRSLSVASTSSSRQAEASSAAASSPAAIKPLLSPRALPFFIPIAHEESDVDGDSTASINEIVAAIYQSPVALSFVPLVLARDAGCDVVMKYRSAVEEYRAALELQDDMGQLRADMAADFERLCDEHDGAVTAFGATVDAWNAAVDAAIDAHLL